MAAFRPIERQHIIMRRAEANACLQYRLFHSATLTACSGIELLLEFLVYRLFEEFSRSSKRRANSLVGDVKAEEQRNSVKTAYWGLKSWIDFYRRHSVFIRLQQQFDFTFQTLNDHTLNEANEVWNKCKHDSYLASPEIATQMVELLNDYLDETDIEADASNQRQLTISELSTHWLGKWELPLAESIAGDPNAPQTSILMCLAPYLDLIIRLLDDRRVELEHKTQLMVAANYVFSSIDLMPENSSSRDVSALVDDGAVLALTLYWLLRQDGFDKAILYSHWPGGNSIIGETSALKHQIWREQDRLFPDSRRQIGFRLVWKVIERIANDGPEALWQNYWKEQSASEADRQRF